MPSGLLRLNATAGLDDDARSRLAEMAQRARMAPARSELLAEGEPLREPRLLLEGWAGMVREMPDGRRQILSLLLPGDLIGMRRHPAPLACATVVALTPISWCPALDDPALDTLYGVSAAAEEAYHIRHIMRLGRMSALERMADLLLELGDRLRTTASPLLEYRLPLTQEMLAEVLGITSVHVNRTLQILRKDGLIELRRSSLRLLRADLLAEMVDYRPVRVSAESPRVRALPEWEHRVSA